LAVKKLAPLVSDPAAAIFNASVREGYVPFSWKLAEVIPASKVIPPISIQNDLRPISLLRTLAKVVENIVGRWLLPFLEPHFDNNQFGCRGVRLTTHAIIALLHSWMACLYTGGSVRTVFVDFRKAFGLVNHNLLFDKLQNVYGIPNCLLNWFGSYLSNRHQRVRANQLASAWKQLNGAMPQGSWLGPLSFLAFISDLTTECLIRKYVDDTTLSEVLESKTLDPYMQAFIENLLDWADRNDMQVNTAKTKEMILGPLARSDLSILSTRVGTVERVSSFKLLRVYIESALSWSLHIDSMVKKLH